MSRATRTINKRIIRIIHPFEPDFFSGLAGIFGGVGVCVISFPVKLVVKSNANVNVKYYKIKFYKIIHQFIIQFINKKGAGKKQAPSLFKNTIISELGLLAS
jgi:hypothetical protein